MKTKDKLPLKISQIIAAMFLSIGCFLGFPNDELLSGLFWAVTTVVLLVEVAHHEQNR